MKKLKTPKLDYDLLAPYYKKFSLEDHKYHNYAPPDKEDCVHFADAPHAIISELVRRDECDPEETQNSSPMVSEFIKFAADAEASLNAKVTLYGYRIRHRGDSRVSLEGFEAVPKSGTKFTVKDILALVEFGRHADEFEVTEDYCRAWWD